MRVDSTIKGTAAFCLLFSAVGYLGAHVVKPLMVNISPPGVALACGQIPFVFLGIIAAGAPKNATIPSIFFAVIASYPIAVLSSNLFYQVHLIHPLVGFAAGGSILAVSGGVVAVSAFIFGLLLPS